MSARFVDYPIRGNRLRISVGVREWLCSHESAFQKIEIVDTESLGRVLFLDGHIQLAELDERAYHEALVHVPLLSIGAPERVLVVGAGDGGVLREVLRHGSVRHVDWVEIDADVIELCRAHMPSLSVGVADDPRVRLSIGDAFEFVRTATGAYDAIIADVTDTYEGEDGALSEQVFSGAFFADCRRLLSPGGMVVSQADNPVFCPRSTQAVVDVFGRVFERHGSYVALVPSFGGFSAFVWGSQGATPASALPVHGMDLRYLNSTTWSLGFTPLPFL